MPLQFTSLDWAILAGYIGVLAIAGYLSTRRAMTKADDYFLASHQAPTWLVAVSVLSTVQSAATFLGAPDYSFRGNFTYLTSNLAAVIAAFFVARVLIPRFYAMNAATVYELLEKRFDVRAMRAAGAMYLVGRILASGARLYLAAIAVSIRPVTWATLNIGIDNLFDKKPPLPTNPGAFGTYPDTYNVTGRSFGATLTIKR